MMVRVLTADYLFDLVQAVRTDLSRERTKEEYQKIKCRQSSKANEEPPDGLNRCIFSTDGYSVQITVAEQEDMKEDGSGSEEQQDDHGDPELHRQLYIHGIIGKYYDKAE